MIFVRILYFTYFACILLKVSSAALRRNYLTRIFDSNDAMISNAYDFSVAILCHPYDKDETSLIKLDNILESFKNISNFNFNVATLPNIYELNDKRYEINWLNYLKLQLLNDSDCVIAFDTGSSEAVLRYLESCKLQRVIFVDAS